jgi:chromate reductase
MRNFFGEGGVIASPDTRAFLQGWMNRYVAWVKQHAG